MRLPTAAGLSPTVDEKVGSQPNSAISAAYCGPITANPGLVAKRLRSTRYAAWLIATLRAVAGSATEWRSCASHCCAEGSNAAHASYMATLAWNRFRACTVGRPKSRRIDWSRISFQRRATDSLPVDAAAGAAGSAASRARTTAGRRRRTFMADPGAARCLRHRPERCRTDSSRGGGRFKDRQ